MTPPPPFGTFPKIHLVWKQTVSSSEGWSYVALLEREGWLRWRRRWGFFLPWFPCIFSISILSMGGRQASTHLLSPAQAPALGTLCKVEDGPTWELSSMPSRLEDSGTRSTDQPGGWIVQLTTTNHHQPFKSASGSGKRRTGGGWSSIWTTRPGGT